eukprot:2614596-Pleurochrysis_carterae.AAC.1
MHRTTSCWSRKHVTTERTRSRWLRSCGNMSDEGVHAFDIDGGGSRGGGGFSGCGNGGGGGGGG